MLNRSFLIVTMFCGALTFCATAHAQDHSEAIDCWYDYADCALHSGGDENWRSICYADFTECIGRRPLQPCGAGGRTKACIEFHEVCGEFIDGSAESAAQCAYDSDACEMAHGC